MEIVVEKGARLKSLSVSVCVAAGAQPRSVEEITRIENMVKSAVGTVESDARTDVVKVVEMDFPKPEKAEGPAWWQKIPIPLSAIGNGILGFLLLIVIAFASRKLFAGLSLQKEDVGVPVKNLYGVLPGGQKTLGHVLGRTHEEFADVLCDLYSLVRPRFAVMDAVTGMSGTWRTQKDRIRPGLILASADGVALDAVACELAGLSPMDVPTLRRAHERGLGVADPARIEVVGETSARIEGFTLPHRTSIVWRLLRLFAPALQKEDPRVVPELCDGCRACEEPCPAHAIGYPDGRARIDLEECIRCFCCLELCPRRAVEIERGWLGRRLFGGH